MKVGFIGCGNLGGSLIRGFLKVGALRAEDIVASDVGDERLKELKKLGVNTTTNNKDLAKSSNVIFIAVKPDIAESVLKEIEGVSGGKLVVSAAAGVSTGFIETHTKARVIRVMPNICGLVGEMASCFSLGTRATRDDAELVGGLLNKIGIGFEIDEKLMDVVTGLSGSGPAYFYSIVKALQDAGVELGLSSEIALKLAAQTAKGAGEMILSSGKKLDDLIRQVRTPKGTTVEGLKVLEDRKVADALKAAVKAATKRAGELSK